MLPPVRTSGGILVLDNASADVTFSAQVGPAVPEPGSFLLFGAGLLGVGWLARRKAAKDELSSREIVS